jgi:hypothetical protein
MYNFKFFLGYITFHAEQIFFYLKTTELKNGTVKHNLFVHLK